MMAGILVIFYAGVFWKKAQDNSRKDRLNVQYRAGSMMVVGAGAIVWGVFRYRRGGRDEE